MGTRNNSFQHFGYNRRYKIELPRDFFKKHSKAPQNQNNGQFFSFLNTKFYLIKSKYLLLVNFNEFADFHQREASFRCLFVYDLCWSFFMIKSLENLILRRPSMESQCIPMQCNEITCQKSVYAWQKRLLITIVKETIIEKVNVKRKSSLFAAVVTKGLFVWTFSNS